MANKALQEIKAYAEYYYSNSTEIFNSTLPISSSTKDSISNSTSSKGSTSIGEYLQATKHIIIKVTNQFTCKQSKLEAPEIYLPKEDLIHNDGCEFLGNIHYDDYPL